MGPQANKYPLNILLQISNTLLSDYFSRAPGQALGLRPGWARNRLPALKIRKEIAQPAGPTENKNKNKNKNKTHVFFAARPGCKPGTSTGSEARLARLQAEEPITPGLNKHEAVPKGAPNVKTLVKPYEYQ